MKLSDILELIDKSPSPKDWMRVNNESGDGGFTMVAVRDVLLCLSLDLVWKGSKPFTRLQITYGSTIISWADLPITPSDTFEDHARVLAALKNLLEPTRNLIDL
jgi:hypothetical protein